MTMEQAVRINRILDHPDYREFVEGNAEKETERIFCKHDLSHFLDVARIGVLLNYEEDYGESAELIYAAALLHDIGRWREYETGEDHAFLSSALAEDILKDCGFSETETAYIAVAIASHRDSGVVEEKNLRGLLYRADKLSRPCFACEATEQCHKKQDKRNLFLVI